MADNDTTFPTLAALLLTLPETGPFVSVPDGSAGVISSQDIRNLALTLDGLKAQAAYGQLAITSQAAAQTLLAGVFEFTDGWDTDTPVNGGITTTKATGRLNTTHDGDHTLAFFASYSFASAADVTWQFALNGTEIGPPLKRKHSNGNDIGAVGGTFTVPMVSGDYVTLNVKTDANETLTIEGAAFELASRS